MTPTRENCPNGTTPEITDTERGTIIGIKTKVQQQALGTVGRDKPVGWPLVAHARTRTKGIKDRVTLNCAGLGHTKRGKKKRRKKKARKWGWLACLFGPIRMPQRRGDGGVRRKKEEGMRNDGAHPPIKRQRRDYNYVARCYMIMYGAAPGWH